MRLIAWVAATYLLAGAQVISGELAIPLDYGTYVLASVQCADASNATSINFTDAGFHLAGVNELEEKVIFESGDQYRVSIVAAEVDYPDSKRNDFWTAKVLNSRDFALTTTDGTFEYRWCSDGFPL